MNEYKAPLKDMRFVMDEIADLAGIAALPGFEEATPDLADAVLDEAARFTGEVLSPLNRVGDVQGCRLGDDGVVTAAGWREAYKAFCDGGWNGLSAPAAFGGQGLPELFGMAVKEMAASANLSFSLCSMLTGGAVAALLTCASDELKATYLEKMVSGEWTGTMNLTEPQAGSDLALLRSKAEPQGDGSYRIFGQKIFITYGDHDMADNVIHLVLARLPDAPPGVKGISLFLVPKFLVNVDGSLGARNDARCVSLEHKLGIHASPTCVMAFGDQGGAVGWLLGEANRGLEYMFIMMNEARLGVGLQGLAVAERAWQLARDYARERRQGRDAVSGEALVSIDRHPDVRRMLMRMKSRIEATRALTYYTSGLLDRAHADPDPLRRREALLLAELLIPLVKGGGTEMGVDVASLGVQVHGGMGYIEESGAAQLWRDARITAIYEGTTGIQANDLVFRKLMRDRGETAAQLFARIDDSVAALQDAGREDLQRLGGQLAAGLVAWRQATAWMLERARSRVADALAGAVPYLELAAAVAGGWMMGLSALAAVRRLEGGDSDRAFLEAKLATARFYADQMMPFAEAQARIAMAGEAALDGHGPELFD